MGYQALRRPGYVASVRAVRGIIAGGTSAIQRKITAQRLLGRPRN